MAANWWDEAPVAKPIDLALTAEGVDGPKADFIRSVYQQESASGKNTKTSNAGAVGGMQIIPATFNRVADKGWDINNPEHNARAGVRYASKVFDLADGDPALAGAGYYGGEGAIDKARKGVAVSDPRNPNAPNTLQYGQQVASRIPPKDEGNWWANAPVVKPTAPVEAPPSPIGTDGENYKAGIGKFAADTGTGIVKAAADMLSNAPDYLPLLKVIGMGLKKAGADPKQVAQDTSNDILETRRLDKPLMDTKAGQGGYLSGGLLTAPVMPAAQTAKGAAVVGTALGAVQPAVNGQERAINALTSGVAGGVGQKVVNSLSRMISPEVAPNVTALLKEGVTPTPGQILGGGFKRAEEGLTSIPVIGDAIKSGQGRAMGELNTAAFNRALTPVGEKLPAGIKGREAVEYVGDTLSKKYQDLLPKMTTRADATFNSEIENLKSLATSGNMGEAEAAQLTKLLDNKMLSKFGGQDAVTGETLKGIERDLNNLAAGYRRDPSFDKQQLGNALTEAQSSLRDLISRNNPQYAKELQQANEGWANFKRVQRAASSVAAEDGAFTPAQLLSATKALDRSKDKGNFAKGDALMQDLAEAGKSTMGSKLPDSGTPFRSMLALMAGGGAGVAAHMTPLGWAASLGGAAAAPLAYSKAGQNALAYALARRPEGAPVVANKLRELASPLALSIAPTVANGASEKTLKPALRK